MLGRQRKCDETHMDDHRCKRCAEELQIVPVALRSSPNASGPSVFGQILDTDGTVLLCLHQWGAHEHPTLMSSDTTSPGNGLLLFFRVDDYEMALKSARALVDRFEEEPHVNPNTQTWEFSLRDPDGYYVTISALSAPQRKGTPRGGGLTSACSRRRRFRKLRERRPRLRR
jgi:hypothetical protein